MLYGGVYTFALFIYNGHTFMRFAILGRALATRQKIVVLQ